MTMRERHLKIELEDAVEAFTPLRWKFYEVKDLAIRLEVPRTDAERFVVELVFQDEEALKAAVARLQEEGFIRQEIKYASA